MARPKRSRGFGYGGCCTASRSERSGSRYLASSGGACHADVARRLWPTVLLAAALLGPLWAAFAGPPDYATERADMVDRLRKSGVKNSYLIAAMSRVPRHLFVSSRDVRRAYDDVSIPIGQGQSIQAPSMVGAALDRLDLKPGRRLLQVGSECPYCTAVLCDIPLDVHVVDYDTRKLAVSEQRLESLRYTAQWVKTKAKACLGWRQHGPFDAILVMCSSSGISRALVDQLKPGGHMVVPIGEGPEQTLQCVTKRPDGKLHIEVIKTPTPVRAPRMSCQKAPP